MKRSLRILLCITSLVVILPLQSCVANRTVVRPGPDFVWVAPYTTPGGAFIHGHWKYVGPPRHSKVWISGHYNRYGDWVPGHWKKLRSPQKGAKWVPGYRTPGGRWIPGHWRYR